MNDEPLFSSLTPVGNWILVYVWSLLRFPFKPYSEKLFVYVSLIISRFNEYVKNWVKDV